MNFLVLVFISYTYCILPWLKKYFRSNFVTFILFCLCYGLCLFIYLFPLSFPSFFSHILPLSFPLPCQVPTLSSSNIFFHDRSFNFAQSQLIIHALSLPLLPTNSISSSKFFKFKVWKWNEVEVFAYRTRKIQLPHLYSPFLWWHSSPKMGLNILKLLHIQILCLSRIFPNPKLRADFEISLRLNSLTCDRIKSSWRKCTLHILSLGFGMKFFLLMEWIHFCSSFGFFNGNLYNEWIYILSIKYFNCTFLASDNELYTTCTYIKKLISFPFSWRWMHPYAEHKVGIIL